MNLVKIALETDALALAIGLPAGDAIVGAHFDMDRRRVVLFVEGARHPQSPLKNIGDVAFLDPQEIDHAIDPRAGDR